MPPQRKSYDAIIIGAGHHGLAAAAYLSRAGFATLVVERPEIVGGCCVMEEIAPGCRASTTS
jgi:phytoene dehydrogenase-like protein